MKKSKLLEYIEKLNISQKDLHLNTNIDLKRIYDLCNKHNAKLTGEELYKLYLGLNIHLDNIIQNLFDEKEIEIFIKEKTYKEELSTFGSWLNKRIITQKEISETTKIRQSRISKLINTPSTKINAVELIKICKFLNINIENTLKELYQNN